jgi:hypothetical protein
MPVRMSNKKYFGLLLVSVFWLCGCTPAQPVVSAPPLEKKIETKNEATAKIKNQMRVVHVLVALCDNEFQGIVPVPAFLGNGEDAAKNLYWGAAFGVKTFFSKSASWTKVSEIDDPKENVLQRIVFKHKKENVYLVADAYRGSRMKETIADFFAAASGEKLENVKIDNLTLQILGSADVIAFVGHNGLMDFALEKEPQKKDDEKRDAIILACASRQYFADALKKTSAAPLLWTSNLMAPEAYVLHDALEGWAGGETARQIQTRAAAAYAKYQKISQKSAEKLLVTGW